MVYLQYFFTYLGKYILLDEINLAPPEILERLSSLLNSRDQGFTLYENGRDFQLPINPSFRFFAAMNPGGEVGKKDLPFKVLSRLSAIRVTEP